MAKTKTCYPKPVKVASIRNLKRIWHNSKDSKSQAGAAGLDRITAEIFRKNLDKNLSKLSEKLVNRSFKFQKLRASLIEKNDNTFRIICVPTIADRLVQRSIHNWLLSPKDQLGVVTKISYGVSSGNKSGVRSAINSAIRLREKQKWVLKTDISKFFDNIPRNVLKNEILKRVKTKSLVPLLLDVVDCEISPANDLQKNAIEKNGICQGRGLRQGMPLSPLLSNLVLRDFDKKMIRKGLSILRYADDIVCFCNSRQECIEAKEFIIDQLQELDLYIPSLEETGSKTKICSPSESVIFLGVEIYKQRTRYNQKIPKIIRTRAISKIRALADLETHFKDRRSYSTVLRNLQEICNGYKAAYRNCTNLSSLLNELKNEAKITKDNLLIDLLGQKVFRSLSIPQKEFLGF